MFLGKTLPVPDLECSVNKVTIGPFTVETIDEHTRGIRAASLANFQYHLRLKDSPPKPGVWRHVMLFPQCQEMVESYRAAIMSEDPVAFDPFIGSHVRSRKYQPILCCISCLGLTCASTQ